MMVAISLTSLPRRSSVDKTTYCRVEMPLKETQKGDAVGQPTSRWRSYAILVRNFSVKVATEMENEKMSKRPMRSTTNYSPESESNGRF